MLLVVASFLSPDNGVDADLQCSGGIATLAPLKAITVICSVTPIVGFISISELEYAMVVTAMKLGMSFRILSMTINLSRLTTGAMNNNAGHE
ncbi:hypothetical protein AU10_22505 [Escherichia coli E1728]|nr:hypothetical protein AU10_22505 [Escherichia coli E1728]